MNNLSALFFPRILEFLEKAKRQAWARRIGLSLFFLTRLSKSQMISLFLGIIFQEPITIKAKLIDLLLVWVILSSRCSFGDERQLELDY